MNKATHTPGEQLAALAVGKWNPYYLAYAIETGANSPSEAFTRDGGNYLFFSWNDKRWDETCRRIGAHRDYCSDMVADHLETLGFRISQRMQEMAHVL